MTIDKKTGEVIDWSKYFIYEDGGLYHHPDRNMQGIPRAKWGAPAGTDDWRGYLKVKVNGAFYKTHRIIYEMCHGEIPESCVIDHIDGNKANNNIDNLRVCTHSENMKNRATHSKRHCHLPRNVYHNKKGYKVQVMANGKNYFGGCHKTIEEAVEAATALRNEHHGEFARHH